MKRPTKNQLRERNIFNSYNLCTIGKGNVYVGYSPEQHGRAYRGAKWQVIRPNFKTDPNGHWTDDGHKTFNVRSREEKEPQRLRATAWASERYNIVEWERDPWGDYHPKGTMERAMSESAASTKGSEP